MIIYPFKFIISGFKNKHLTLVIETVMWHIVGKSRFNIDWIDSVDSTNNEVKRRMERLSDLSVISATEQTSGRGQRGNIWLSEPGKNLTFSIAVKYGDRLFADANPVNQFVINGIVSLSVVELLETYGIDAGIKLPNDIYVNGKKICGILIEHSVLGYSLIHSIIGVGLNVNQMDFDESLANPTSILLEIGGDEIHLPSLLEKLLDIFLKYAEIYTPDEIQNIYQSKLLNQAKPKK